LEGDVWGGELLLFAHYYHLSLVRIKGFVKLGGARIRGLDKVVVGGTYVAQVDKHI
jgi:hypothetical protein